MINRKLIDRIIADFKGGNMAEHIAIELSEVEIIRRNLNHAFDDLREEEERHRAAVSICQHDIEGVRNHCKHWTRTRHPDPSGGSDSSDACDQCGKEL